MFGLITGLFARLRVGAPPLALRSLVAISALVVLINVEVDLGLLLLNLWHETAAILIFYLALKFLRGSGASQPQGVR